MKREAEVDWDRVSVLVQTFSARRNLLAYQFQGKASEINVAFSQLV